MVSHFVLLCFGSVVALIGKVCDSFASIGVILTSNTDLNTTRKRERLKKARTKTT